MMKSAKRHAGRPSFMKQTGSFIERPILSPLLPFTAPVLLALFYRLYTARWT